MKLKSNFFNILIKLQEANLDFGRHPNPNKKLYGFDVKKELMGKYFIFSKCGNAFITSLL
jgi:hypothetical protein